MSEKENKIVHINSLEKASLERARELIKEIIKLPGMMALNRILDHENPGTLVRSMTRVDFYWLVKKIGEEDSLPLLKLATNDHWQYLCDMELWQKDRISPQKVFPWIERFFDANPERLSKWLFGDGNLLAHHFFNGLLQVEIRKEDDDRDFSKDFFTLDNLYFIKVLVKEQEEIIEKLIRTMASVDYDRYQALMLGLAGVIPSEVEEEMHRLRGVRLAEDGYLPFDEAISVYSYLKSEDIKTGESEYKLFLPVEDEMKAIVPLTPITYADRSNFLAKSIDRISDLPLLDRLSLEFGGLCNQIMSADGIIPEEHDDLIRIGRKAASYITLGLEKVTNKDPEMARQILQNNPLAAIFRAGFSLTLDLKWEVERWLKNAWFKRCGFDVSFWAEAWEGILTGLTAPKPVYFTGAGEDIEFRDFQSLDEIRASRKIIKQLIVLDMLFDALYGSSINKEEFDDPIFLFYPLLFNHWAGIRLNIQDPLKGLTLNQVKRFYRTLRKDETSPPYVMKGFKEVFIDDFMSLSLNFSHVQYTMLNEILGHIWELFVDEYANVLLEDLDKRFLKFFFVRG